MASDRMWETVPSYSELFYGMTDFVNFFWNISDQVTPSAHFRQIKEDHRVGVNDIWLVIFFAAIWTGFRHSSTKFVFQPIGRYCNLPRSNQEKMPESAWKFLYYLTSWSYTLYLVVFKYQFFQRPSLVWQGWSLTSEVPTDLYVLYMMQSSFYLHSIYATAFLDTWRKDSVLLLAHHVLTLGLLAYSHAFNFHNMGSLVLLFHDVSDIELEFTKLNVYFKIQANKLVKFHEAVANVGFVLFALTWFISRLYFFPLKALYAAAVITYRLDLIGKLPILPFINGLLWLLLAMNVYWFMLILGFMLRVATGQIKELDDTREYDVEEKIQQTLKTTTSKPVNGIHCNGNTELSSSTSKDSTEYRYPPKRKQAKTESN